MKQLTERQIQVIEYIRQTLRERGYGPSVREIGKELGINSPNGVMCHLRALEKKGMIKRESNLARAITLTRSATAITVLGTVRAGRPVFSDEVVEELDFADMLGAGRFALRVEGDSMRDSIIAGSIVIVNAQSHARDGQIVIAVADGEHTIKRIRFRDGRTWLEPANSEYDAFAPDELEILGVVVGAIQRFQ